MSHIRDGVTERRRPHVEILEKLLLFYGQKRNETSKFVPVLTIEYTKISMVLTNNAVILALTGLIFLKILFIHVQPHVTSKHFKDITFDSCTIVYQFCCSIYHHAKVFNFRSIHDRALACSSSCQRRNYSFETTRVQCRDSITVYSSIEVFYQTSLD